MFVLFYSISKLFIPGVNFPFQNSADPDEMAQSGSNLFTKTSLHKLLMQKLWSQLTKEYTYKIILFVSTLKLVSFLAIHLNNTIAIISNITMSAFMDSMADSVEAG